ncbi:MAG: cytosol nonspecific dipeptidase, partial [Bacteroidaceae bacterium]|nr:cytosol nonspecific dipeptidase [Bacteroidaceae bacterium]
KDAVVNVTHGGLECGLIGSKYPEMDMVSFGPTLSSPHTPDERCYIPSVARFYDLVRKLVETL